MVYEIHPMIIGRSPALNIAVWPVLNLAPWGNDVTYRGKVIAEENRVGDEIRQEEERTRKRRDSRFPL
jgi:hypothetical protein